MIILRVSCLYFFIVAASGFEIVDAVSSNVENRNGIYVFKSKGDLAQVPEVLYEELNIFCYNGSAPSLANFWGSAEMRLKIQSEDYHVYMGDNVTMVQKMHADHKASWFYSTLPWKSKSLKLNPFEETCLGVLSRDEYSLSLHVAMVNYWQVIMTLMGLALFYYAPRLCRNVFFHYTTGVGAGVFLSLVVITYFVQRRFNVWYGWAFAGYSLSLYFLTSIWYNLKVYLVENYVYVLGYLLATGGVSFAVCYRMGPIVNPRSLDLIQWTLQTFALVLVFLSSYYQTASLSLALAILSWASIPDKLKTRIQVQYHKRFVRPKIKLLTETEYLDQSRIETEKALNELRSYCKSPRCDAWKVTSRLQSPTRFAEFVEGGSHITQDEVVNYSQIDEDDMNSLGAGDLHLTDDNSSDEEGLDLGTDDVVEDDY